jgi:hypothetical protein
MSTPAQIAANQANAVHSTGPRTEEGKSAASKNSTRHGFTGKVVLIAGENPEEFNTHLQEYIAQHKPATIDEEFLVTRMAEAMWRLNRLRRFEAAIFDKEPAVDPIAELLKLSRYEKSLESSYFRASKELRAIRKDQTTTVQAEKKQKVAEFSAALDEIMYGPLPTYNPAPRQPITPDTKRTQSSVRNNDNPALRL